jgi:hypothetical protein
LQDPAIRADIRTARTLGISYKRFQGWEPTTTYEYDDGGRLISSRPEVEWDQTEQDWMLALDTWENDELCHLCGWPKDVCQAPETEWALEVPLPTRCHVTTAIKRAQMARAADGGGRHDDALVWGARLKDQSPYSRSAQSSPVSGPRSVASMPDIEQ